MTEMGPEEARDYDEFERQMEKDAGYSEAAKGQAKNHSNDSPMLDLDRLRELFLKYLTVDSETKDARRREFNQAIFIDPKDAVFGGRQVFTGTDLDMVMKKFDKAVKEFKKKVPHD